MYPSNNVVAVRLAARIVTGSENNHFEFPMIKIIICAIWLLIVANLFLPFAGEYHGWLNWLGVILIVAHLIEYLVFAEQIKAKGDGTVQSFVMTMLFGVAYIKA